MAATLVVARGPSVFLVRSAAAPEEFAPPGSRGRPAADGPSPAVLAKLAERLRALGGEETVEAIGSHLTRALGNTGTRPVRAAAPRAWRPAQLRLPEWPPKLRREYLLALARDAVDRAFRSPEEIVVSLAREEARFERTVDREERASEAFVRPPRTRLETVAEDWQSVREKLREHGRALERQLDEAASALLPNLSAVVGARTAARLLAAAGGLAALARCSSSRLQLLGVRRRPSPDRGPKYGVLYRADCLGTVPPARRAAFARSVASLAVIAARADATTRADLAPALLARRERRALQLRRGGR